MHLRQRAVHSSESPRLFKTEEERRVYEPTFAKSLENRGCTARPISSRTCQQFLSDGDTLCLYGNGLYGDEKEICPNTRPQSSPHQSSKGGRQTFAERRRSDRIKGGYNSSFLSNTVTSQTTLPSTATSQAILSKKSSTSSTNESTPSVGTVPSSSQAIIGSPKTPVLVEYKEEQDESDVVSGSVSRLVLPAQATQDQMQAFLTAVGGRRQPFTCFILRDRSQSKIYPTYKLFANESGAFLLTARRRKKSKSSNYLISLMESDLARGSQAYFGKVRSNFIGTQFTVYNKGEKPDATRRNIRSELGAVLYERNILGTKGPRKMTAIIPRVYPNGKTSRFQPLTPKESITAQYKEGKSEENLMCLVNKAPKWNDQLNAYCLNFKGRVTEASVKNFQLVSEEDPEKVVLQFGKVGKDRFNMDFSYPVSAFQAFAICLTSCDSKLACE